MMDEKQYEAMMKRMDASVQRYQDNIARQQASINRLLEQRASITNLCQHRADSSGDDGDLARTILAMLDA